MLAQAFHFRTERMLYYALTRNSIEGISHKNRRRLRESLLKDPLSPGAGFRIDTAQHKENPYNEQHRLYDLTLSIWEGTQRYNITNMNVSCRPKPPEPIRLEVISKYNLRHAPNTNEAPNLYSAGIFVATYLLVTRLDPTPCSRYARAQPCACFTSEIRDSLGLGINSRAGFIPTGRCMSELIACFGEPVGGIDVDTASWLLPRDVFTNVTLRGLGVSEAPRVGFPRIVTDSGAGLIRGPQLPSFLRGRASNLSSFLISDVPEIISSKAPTVAVELIPPNHRDSRAFLRRVVFVGATGSRTCPCAGAAWAWYWR
ncbi:hypothetical protein B0H17DRAFT_1213297 [Mycena rosella]|uniref:Uncharacterized protein n=1 Tax=Mycena rosella TaxID=1033263 RepID=A0AAD7CQE9_MYCRO|nr:hypothetical protein B0H17DRAFT_1213297 [Mycena rosella]